MRSFFQTLMAALLVALLAACGGVEDKEGNALQVGQEYVMTEEGLELAPHPIDLQGNPLEAGKEYVMTPNGLALVPYFKDKEGNRVEVGNEYVMTEQGLKLVVSRGIKGVIQDGAGKPVAGATVAIAESDYKTATRKNGSFTLPFIEGYVRLTFEIPGLPAWCKVTDAENPSVGRERFPDGWTLEAVKLPCVMTSTEEGKSAWATPDGRFVDNGDGTVSDLRNRLTWEAEVKKSPISWNSAEEYAADLSLGDKSGWRLPSPDELKTLYEAGIACTWSGPNVIRGALSVWSSEHVEDSALVFNVCSGGTRKSSGLDEGPNVNTGVLAVRQF